MSRVQYDRQLTVFSPEGRLYQVEYAFKAARAISDTGLGFVGSGISCLVASKKVPDKLMNPADLTNMYTLTKNIGLLAMGRASDCRTIVQKAREFAHEFTYQNGYEIPVAYLTKKVADYFQKYTQHLQRRCFGCDVIFCGWDDEDKHQIFHCDPAGQSFGYTACAIGGKQGNVNNHLDKVFKEWKDKDSRELIIEEALLALMQGTANDYKANDLEVMVCEPNGLVRKLSQQEIDDRLTAISDRD